MSKPKFQLSNGCPGEPLIQMREITKVFRSTAGEFTALKGITACFYRGEFVSVVGKSGSGKSTLANMITGIDHPTTGVVDIDGVEVHHLSENDMSLWRGRNLGIVFQFFQLLPMLTLEENVMLPMDFAGLYEPAEREQRAMELLELVGLAEVADKLPAAVSGGQQQSAAIARALATDPPILIADEPTGNLDSRTAEQVFDIFRSLAAQGKTIVMVTHDPALARRTDRMLVITDGELIDGQISNTFPMLPHRRMAWMNRRMTRRRLASGEMLTAPARHGAGLLLLTEGEAAGLDASGAPDGGTFLPGVPLSYLHPALSSAWRAGPAGLEVLTLDAADLEAWITEFPADRAMLAPKTNADNPGFEVAS